MVRGIIAVLALMVTSCATTLAIVPGPDSTQWYVASCSKLGVPCMEAADSLCKERGGYKILNQTTATSGSWIAVYTMQAIYFRCNENPPGPLQLPESKPTQAASFPRP